MKVLLKYSTTSYGCQEHEGKIGNWMSAGDGQQVLEFVHNPELTPLVQAIKEHKTPYQFGNSHTIYSRFSIEVIEE